MKKLPLSIVCKRLGLGISAHTVYETLERYGPLGISGIARAGTLHRPAAYRGVRELEDLRLVSQASHGKRTIYTAASRARVAEVFEKFVRAADAGIRAGSQKQHGQPLASDVRVFEGDTAVRDIFDDAIASSARGDTFYRITSERDVDEINALLPPGYRARRDKKHLERLVISNTISSSGKRDRLERFIRHLGSDAEPFEHNVIKLIYGAKIAYIDIFSRKGFVVTNAHVADFERTLFRALYKRLV